MKEDAFAWFAWHQIAAEHLHRSGNENETSEEASLIHQPPQNESEWGVQRPSTQGCLGERLAVRGACAHGGSPKNVKKKTGQL